MSIMMRMISMGSTGGNLSKKLEIKHAITVRSDL